MAEQVSTTKRTVRKKPAARKAAPRKRAVITTDDVQDNSALDIDISSHVSDDDIDRPDLAMVTDDDMNSPTVQEYVRELAFMEEILTVSIGESSDPNAENPVGCGVNGAIKLLTRGHTYQLQRKFVDSLIKREDTIKTVQYKDDDGCDQTRIKKTPALKYPITVHADPSGQLGARWFKHQCANAW